MNIQCQNQACKKIFPSGFSFGDSKNVKMSGNISVCPHCRFHNKLPEGIVDFENDRPIIVRTLSSLSGPSLEKLQTLIEKTKEENLSFEDFKQEVSKISPSLANQIQDSIRSNKNLLVFLAFLLGILLQVKPLVQGKINLSRDQIFKKEIRKSLKKEKAQKSIEKESFSMSESKREADKARRKFLEDQKKINNGNI